MPSPVCAGVWSGRGSMELLSMLAHRLVGLSRCSTVSLLGCPSSRATSSASACAARPAQRTMPSSSASSLRRCGRLLMVRRLLSLLSGRPNRLASYRIRTQPLITTPSLALVLTLTLTLTLARTKQAAWDEAAQGIKDQHIEIFKKNTALTGAGAGCRSRRGAAWSASSRRQATCWSDNGGCLPDASPLPPCQRAIGVTVDLGPHAATLLTSHSHRIKGEMLTWESPGKPDS